MIVQSYISLRDSINKPQVPLWNICNCIEKLVFWGGRYIGISDGVWYFLHYIFREE